MQIVMIPNGKGGTPWKKNFVEPGRNKPCVCGSGKKYKHCCLDKFYAQVREKVVEASKKNVEAGKAVPLPVTRKKIFGK